MSRGAGGVGGPRGPPGAPRRAAPGGHADTIDLEDLGPPQGAPRHRQEQQGPRAVYRHRGDWARSGGSKATGGTSRPPPSSGHGAPSGGPSGGGLPWPDYDGGPSGGGPSGVPPRSSLEAAFGVDVWRGPGERSAYLYNVVQTLVTVNSSKEKKELFSGLNLYFVCSDGATFRTTVLHRPHFVVAIKRVKGVSCDEVSAALGEMLSKYNVQIHHAKLEDLADPSHLARFGPADPSLACDEFGALKRKRDFLRVSFRSVRELVEAKQDLRRLVRENRQASSNGFGGGKASRVSEDNEGDPFKDIQTEETKTETEKSAADATILVDDIYEADVLYVTRCCIDLNIRCGRWYRLSRSGSSLEDKLTLQVLEAMTASPPLDVLAWDIECAKQPLKFPDAEQDEVILISYVFNGQGYLIVNKHFLSQDIPAFVFQPKPELRGAGAFAVFNEADEKSLLKRFIQHIIRLKPHILATYNGDNFDLPYVIRRAQLNDLNFSGAVGMLAGQRDEAVLGLGPLLHLDCFKWVERDSYLPQGSRTLKAVCKVKLRFNPVEVDPEEMVPLAREDPQRLAVYSVSDAVATYYLYEQFIHSFVLALSSIIPMNPEMVLRQGSGTLCENLLMAEAFARSVLFPNKHEPQLTRYWRNPKTQKLHLILEESYVGGRVESLKCGIYRSDLEELFSLSPAAYSRLLSEVDEVLSFWLLHESQALGLPAEQQLSPVSFSNWEETVADIKQRLSMLRDTPIIKAKPLLLHLDVAAMYPNIILTQRLQPPAIKTQATCRECPWFEQASECQRRLRWNRKLEVSPAEKGTLLSLQQDLQMRMHSVSSVSFPGAAGGTRRRAPLVSSSRGGDGDAAERRQQQQQFDALDEGDSGGDSDDLETQTRLQDKEAAKETLKSWAELTERQKHAELVKATKKYCQRAHKKTKLLKEVEEESIVCQRENPFYVETVRAFRDRRYIFKKRLKAAEALRDSLEAEGGSFEAKKDAADAVLLNDSLQLAHKCILNSFYGYVKREGARWYSMEMGALVTKMGADIIQAAKEIIDGLGVSMELDTDGIWCLLPIHFPLRYTLHLREKNKSLKLEYPTWVLNMEVTRRFSNPQYLFFDEAKRHFVKETRNEIFFELDGPWRAMFLPASEKTDDLLKKRYVVYANDGHISELKGFELKRRGELEFIRLFQRDLFSTLIEGKTKQEAYSLAAAVGQRYRYLLLSQGAAILNHEELERLLVARKVLGKSVETQVLAKSMSITTAKRLAELLNNKTYLSEAPVSTQYLVVSLPRGAEKTSRAIPVQLLQASETVRRQYLQKWLLLSPSDAALVSANIKQVIDWGYYTERLDAQLQKIILIPALKQGLQNPIPGVDVPTWLLKQQAAADPRQQKLHAFFKPQQQKQQVVVEGDSESAAAAAAAAERAKQEELKREKMQQQLLLQQQQKQQQLQLMQEERKQERILFKNDFGRWIETQRIRWKHIREELRVSAQEARLAPAGIPRFLSRLLRGQKEVHAAMEKLLRASRLPINEFGALLGDTWHVLDFHRSNSDDPGVYTIRFTTPKSRRFFAMPFQVYRHLYVNSTTPFSSSSSSSSSSSDNEIKIKAVTGKHILPRGLEQLHLLELQMTEKIFVEKKEIIQASFHQKAAGIFETHLPLDFAFLSRVGHTMEPHTTELATILDDSGIFSSLGFSRSRSSALGGFLKKSFGDYLRHLSPLIIHVFHGKRSRGQAGDTLEETDRIFCAVYEPLVSPDGDAKGDEETPVSFFVGGAAAASGADPYELQQQLLQQAIEKQQQQQQQQQRQQQTGVSSEEEADDEDKTNFFFNNQNSTEGLQEVWLTTDPAELRAFGASYSFRGAPYRVFNSSSSSSAATAAAIARAQKRDIINTLRALEDCLLLKQQQQERLASQTNPKKYVILLFSTLPPSELGAWAADPQGAPPGGPPRGPPAGALRGPSCVCLSLRLSRSPNGSRDFRGPHLHSCVIGSLCCCCCSSTSYLSLLCGFRAFSTVPWGLF